VLVRMDAHKKNLMAPQVAHQEHQMHNQHSPHQQWADQHLAYLRQTSTNPPAGLVHQHQSQTLGAHSHQEGQLTQCQAGGQLQQHQAALVAIQDLERQRVQK
jgi:hypothetical protein